MIVTLPDPPFAEGFPVFGSVVGDNEFQGTLAHGLFRTMVPDPNRLEGANARHNTDLSGIAALRSRVQRLIANAKKKNVDLYANYIIEMTRSGEGFTPQIVLYSQKKLRTEIDPQTGLAWLLVPHELKFVAIDGDTQTAARNKADRVEPGLLDSEKVKVTIKHGIPVDVAEQIFADCNRLGVKVSTSQAIGMDNRDDATILTKYLEARVPMLNGLVNRMKRQLSASDTDVITISALRASVVCLIEGINGVQNQTKPVEIDDAVLPLLKLAATAWYQTVTVTLNGALTPEQRSHNFAASPSVWCAIGALGHDTLVDLAGEDLLGNVSTAALEHAFQQLAETKLANIDWNRSNHWLSCGAKRTETGKVTLGGPKETGSLVFRALKDGSLSRVQAQAA